MNHAVFPNKHKRAGLSAAALAVLVLPLAGCGKNLNCSAEETRDLVYQIAGQSFRKAFNIPEDKPYPGLKFSLADIITREKAGNKAMCAAKLHMTVPVDPKIMPNATTSVLEHDADITYTLERTDDGRLYATVYGL
ncbi:MAG: hypothetical protein J0H78_07915 [Rhizobiales bacterium]|nr:hypothetical protein [Hyphomicrobiales bacterium]OJY41860.1 MAG: hypothetical protein BGP08_10955 [Rhizobiales bacterium 64-17]